MQNEKEISWIAQIMAIVGVLVWVGVTIHFKLYPIAMTIAVTAVPATIYNLVREARSTEPVCR